VADWLVGHADAGAVMTTHCAIAADLITAREVVSRILRDFARKGWIVQERGCIRLVAQGALSRLSRGAFVPSPSNAKAFAASRG
jgi:CRP/FNR family transcriptional regulator